MKSVSYQLNDRYLLAVYVFLQQNEDLLDDTQQALYLDLQRVLFQELTLEEVENIESVYNNA
ncbi:hypothetical protein [Spirochaeta dissipatitropha]